MRKTSIMINRIFKGILGLFLLTAVMSCNKEDDSVFNESATERLSKQEAELREALDSSEYGWKLVYFTDDSSLGGFTFLFDFLDDKNVRMVSDFDDESLVPQQSEFEVQLRATTSLVFVTNNHIHKISDPIDSPVETGKGYKGDFQFRYYGKTEDEIIFRTTKTFKELRFTKATAEDWNLINKNREIAEKVFNVNKALFRSLEVNNGGNITEHDMFYNAKTRFFTMQEKGLSLTENDGFGVGFTDTGIVVSPAIDVDGELISNFTYEPSTGNFISMDSDNIVVKIKYLDKPIVWTNDYKKLLPSSLGTGAAMYFMITDREEQIYWAENTSQFVRDAMDAVGKDSRGNLDLEQVSLVTRASDSYMRYIVKGKEYIYFFNVSDGGGYLKLTPAGWNNEAEVPQKVKDLNKLLAGDPKGMFVKVEDYRIRYSGYKVVSYFSASSASSITLWQNFGNGIVSPF